jgi:hypothetical protein
LASLSLLFYHPSTSGVRGESNFQSFLEGGTIAIIAVIIFTQNGCVVIRVKMLRLASRMESSATCGPRWMAIVHWGVENLIRG